MDSCITVYFTVVVHALGGRRHFRVQSGERDKFPGDLQLLRQDGALQEHRRDPAHSRRNSGYVL